MAHTGETSVFDLDRPFDGAAFKEIVIDAGYTETALAKTLGMSGAHERQDLEVSLRTACRAAVRLDRIAPPLVISPESRFVFRDTDLPGDAVSEHASGAPAEG